MLRLLDLRSRRSAQVWRDAAPWRILPRMARQRLSEDGGLAETLRVCLAPADARRVHAEAKALGLTISEYLRALLNRGKNPRNRLHVRRSRA